MEMSKKLAAFVSLCFFITVAASWLSWFYVGDVPLPLLNFVSVPYMVIITGYFTKSCIENCGRSSPAERADY